MVMTKKKPECPESRHSWYDGTALCNLNDKVCVLESGNTCEYYEEYLKKVEEDESPTS